MDNNRYAQTVDRISLVNGLDDFLELYKSSKVETVQIYGADKFNGNINDVLIHCLRSRKNFPNLNEFMIIKKYSSVKRSKDLWTVRIPVPEA